MNIASAFRHKTYRKQQLQTALNFKLWLHRFTYSSLSWTLHRHMIEQAAVVVWYLWALAALHSTTRGRYHTNMDSLWVSSVSWLVHSGISKQADQSGAMCDLRCSRAAVIIYRCGPAALMMGGCWGGSGSKSSYLVPNNQHHLWCCLVSVNRSGFSSSGGWLFWIKLQILLKSQKYWARITKH